MVVATRAMYLLSGVIILASGVCIEMRFAGILSAPLRMYIVLASVTYFGWQLWRFVCLECRKQGASNAKHTVRKLGLDFGRQ
jgi:hypothetical protein